MFNYHLHKFQENMFDFIFYATWIIYFALLVGFINQEPKYLTIVHQYMPIYISLFLILRFNPFRHVKFTELDRKIAYSAGFFILTTTIIQNFIEENYINQLKKSLGL